MGNTSPILRSETPGVTSFCRIVIIGSVGAIVFSVKEDDINTYFCRLCLQLASYLEEYTYTTGSIVGSEDRGTMILRVRIGICPRTTIPMGTEEHALL